mgnify:CR=1 FL=1
MRAHCELCDCRIGEGWCKTCSDWLSHANAKSHRRKLGVRGEKDFIGFILEKVAAMQEKKP